MILANLHRSLGSDLLGHYTYHRGQYTPLQSRSARTLRFLYFPRNVCKKEGYNLE